MSSWRRSQDSRGNHVLEVRRPTQLSSPSSSKDSSKRVAETLRLKAKFESLDALEIGLLRIEDLQCFAERGGEAVDGGGLMDLLRVMNGLPTSGSAKGACAEHDDSLGVTFPQFAELMGDGVPLDRWGSELESCVQALRRACLCQQRGTPSQVSCEAVRASKRRAERRATLDVKKVTDFWLETLPLTVILLNTLVAGLSTDFPEQEKVWDVAEYGFVAFYSMEFVVKVRLFGCREYFTGAECWWNIFDVFCLLMSLIDVAAKVIVTAILDSQTNSDNALFMLIKIFRLTRLARLVRTLRFKMFQELKMMVLGVVSGLRVLTWAIVLLVMLAYLVGVGMTNMVGTHEPEFGSVRSSMFTLFRCWTDGCSAYDGTPLAERLRFQYGPAYMIFHILMSMFVSVGLFNLIMATFIDNVVNNHLARKQAEMVEKSPLIETRFKKQIISFVEHGLAGERMARSTFAEGARNTVDVFFSPSKRHSMLDKTAIAKEWETLRELNVAISKELFMGWLEDRDFQQLLDDAEIDTVNRSELFDVLDADGGGHLSMDELTTGLMTLRGTVTKSDVVAIRLKVGCVTKILEDWLSDSRNEMVIGS